MSRVTQARKGRTPSRKPSAVWRRMVNRWHARLLSGRYHTGIHFVEGRPAFLILDVGGLPQTSGSFRFAADLTSPWTEVDFSTSGYDGSALWTGQEAITPNPNPKDP